MTFRVILIPPAAEPEDTHRSTTLPGAKHAIVCILILVVIDCPGDNNGNRLAALASGDPPMHSVKMGNAFACEAAAFSTSTVPVNRSKEH